ncbi:MAG: hypothetical protein J6J42_11430 [Lachnospiraceae bacterium]|nr:hypothetical protein [Lachnospiraceae bacterium]MBP3610932.1 hypothetical protein [Lachnospiraceae bacterium]
MRKKIVTVVLLGLCSILLAACGSSQKNSYKPKPTTVSSTKPKPTIVAAATPTPTAVPQPELPDPTATPEPTKAPDPTATPKPTQKPKPTATPKPADPYKRGTLSEKGFESKWLNLRFTTPPDVLMLSQVELDSLAALAEKEAGLEEGTAVFEMMAQYPSGTNVMVEVEKISKEYKNMTEKQVLEEIQNELLNNSGGLNYFYEEEPHTQKFAGETYTGFSMATEYGEDWLVHMDYLMRKKDDYMITILFTYQEESEEELETLVSCFGPYNSDWLAIQDSYERGIITADGYESDWLGIQFKKPEQMTMVKQSELAAYYEMKAEWENDGPAVAILTEKKAYDTMTPEEYIRELQYELEEESNGILYTIEDGIGIADIAGQEYLTLGAMADYGAGLRNWQQFYVREQDNRMVVILVGCLEGEEGTLPGILDCFSPLP